MYLRPSVSLAGGCSLTELVGMTHETAGSVPLLGRGREVVDALHVAERAVLLHVGEVGSGFDPTPSGNSR